MESYSLYDGGVDLVFDEAAHAYTANGVTVPSVTGALKVIAKPALLPWGVKMTAEYVANNLKPGVALDELEIKQLVTNAKKAHRVRTDTAADLGVMAHAWAEDYMLGKNPKTPVNKELKNMTDGFLRFLKTHDVVPVAVERKLYSKRLGIAGTADLIATIDGEFTMADYKSGSNIYAEHLAQMGAYDILYSEEMQDVGKYQPITRHMVINFNKSGDLQVAISSSVERNKAAFEAALTLQRSLDAMETERKQIIEKIR